MLSVYKSHKSASTVLLEAAFVGATLIVLVTLLQFVAPKLYGSQVPQSVILFIAGALFHLIFEYTGVNTWYSMNYCKLIK